MAALRSRCRHYIFALWFLSIFDHVSDAYNTKSKAAHHTAQSQQQAGYSTLEAHCTDPSRLVYADTCVQQNINTSISM